MKKEIIEAIEEQKLAMLEMYELDVLDTEIKTKKIKAQKRLSLAKEKVRSITFN